MNGASATARQLLQGTGDHPVISLYFDLNPEEFATAPARASQARALVDEGRRACETMTSLGHEDRKVLGQDLTRIDDYLGSDELPVSGAGAVAIFCSGQDDLFETVALRAPVASSVSIAPTPRVEPLVTQGDDERWGAALVTGREAKIFLGEGRELISQEHIEDYVRGQGEKTGVHRHAEEQDVERHLKAVADTIFKAWQSTHFAALALSGPTEDVARLEELLHNDVRPTLLASHLDVDIASAGDTDVREKMLAALDEKAAADRGRALAKLTETTRAVSGVDPTLEALNERRVETLLLSRDFASSGGECPSCGLVVAESEGACPADGTPLRPVSDLREAAVHVALAQDARVFAFDEPQDELPPARPIGALLRF
jgi:hypothetical protein